jgi:hypothetical protein
VMVQEVKEEVEPEPAPAEEGAAPAAPAEGAEGETPAAPAAEEKSAE